MKTISRNIKSLTALLAACLMLIACSKEKHFTIKGQIDAYSSGSVCITYYADGGLKRATTTPVDGKFILTGNSDKPTLCLLETTDGKELATLVVADGDEITVEGSATQPLRMKVKGNSTSTKIAEWLTKNAPTLNTGNHQLINQAIAEFVKNNTGNMAATALLVTRFHTPGFESLADSLFTAIKPDARPASLVQGFNTALASQLTKSQPGDVHAFNLYLRSDTSRQYSPFAHTLSLLVFRPDQHQPGDSIGKMLADLSKRYSRPQLKVIEISTARDSVRWKQSTARDSASWDQTWIPAAAASAPLQRLNVPSVPYIIVADSLGTQLCRTSSVKQATKFIDTRLKSHK